MWKTDSLEKTWCWERLKVRVGVDRGWDSWMASPTQWTWVWASSRSWWWTWRPGMLQFMGSQRVGHNWATELNWIIIIYYIWRSSAWIIKSINSPLTNPNLILLDKPKVSMPLLSSCGINLQLCVLTTDILITQRFNNWNKFPKCK